MKKFFKKRKKVSRELPFKRTFKDGVSFERWLTVLRENTLNVEKMFRGNHGGGCPSISE